MPSKPSRQLSAPWASFGVGSILALGLIYGVAHSHPSQAITTFDVKHYARNAEYTNPDSWHQDLPQTEFHIETPAIVRGIYLTSWTTGNALQRKRILEFIKDSKTINAVVIDIKDSTGTLSYTGSEPTIKALGTYSKRIRNLSAVVKEFHEAGIYVIGRIASFEDQYLGERNESFVLKDIDGNPWYGARNTRGWIDPSNTLYHKYLVTLAREAYASGVDEINFDYVRYPSEGKLSNISLPKDKTKQQVITEFFSYIDEELREQSKIPISADVFGLTTTGSGDMGIGQVWENLIPHVDYISPMIYPSHYAAGSFGYANPAEFPREVITQAMQGALDKTLAIGESTTKIRPWIQDFNLGARYDITRVREQIEALEALGGGAYMSWDPRNNYTQGAYNE